MKKRFWLIFGLILIVLAVLALAIFKLGFLSKSAGNSATENSSAENSNQVSLPEEIKTAVQGGVDAVKEIAAAVKEPPAQDGLPVTFDQDVPFARQAPFGAWEVEFYQEGCEEASLIIASRWFQKFFLDEAIMKEELDKIAFWELKRFGFNLNTNTEEVVTMAKEYFGLKAEISKEVTVEKIKQEIAAGNLIILPLTGRELHNPYYTGIGPLYHMLVVKGYDRDQFITNDPGTRLGKNYKYDYQTLIDATHDWNGGDIYQGEKMMLVVSKGK